VFQKGRVLIVKGKEELQWKIPYNMPPGSVIAVFDKNRGIILLLNKSTTLSSENEVTIHTFDLSADPRCSRKELQVDISQHEDYFTFKPLPTIYKESIRVFIKGNNVLSFEARHQNPDSPGAVIRLTRSLKLPFQIEAKQVRPVFSNGVNEFQIDVPTIKEEQEIEIEIHVKPIVNTVK